MTTWPDGTPRSSANAFCIPPKSTKQPEPKKLTTKNFWRDKEFISVSTQCETKEEREAWKKTYAEKKMRELLQIRKNQLLRVNRHTELGAHGGLSKGQKAPR